MWKFKKFKTRELMQAWIDRNKDHVQYTEIFINNGYALEYKKNRRVL